MGNEDPPRDSHFAMNGSASLSWQSPTSRNIIAAFLVSYFFTFFFHRTGMHCCWHRHTTKLSMFHPSYLQWQRKDTTSVSYLLPREPSQMLIIKWVCTKGSEQLWYHRFGTLCMSVKMYWGDTRYKEAKAQQLFSNYYFLLKIKISVQPYKNQ